MIAKKFLSALTFAVFAGGIVAAPVTISFSDGEMLTDRTVLAKGKGKLNKINKLNSGKSILNKLTKSCTKDHPCNSDKLLKGNKSNKGLKGLKGLKGKKGK